MAGTDTISGPVTTYDDKEAFHCVRIEFILAHVNPAGCTSSDAMDAPIVHNEGGQLNELDVGSFWWYSRCRGPVSCAFLLDEMLNQFESVENLDPKLGFSIQGGSVTKHDLYTLLFQGNHCWVLCSIYHAAFIMQAGQPNRFSRAV